MPKEIANKTKEETYYKCTHCGDEIFWNTHKKFTYCKCKKIWIDSCEDWQVPQTLDTFSSFAIMKAYGYTR